MTLILGIKCSDGIVIAADGAATLGSMGQQTVRQPVKKLTIIDNSVVVGVSGPVGLGQRISGIITDMWIKKEFSSKPPAPPPKPYEIMTMVREKLWPHMQQELQIAKVASGAIGPNAFAAALSSTILAMPCNGGLSLFQFDQQGSPEESTDDLPFVSVGSGQKSADPFLAFLRRTLWPNRPPTLADGTFAAYWALDYSIQGDPGGVADPKQLVVLKREGKAWRANELKEDDLREHQQSMEIAHGALASFRESLESPGPGDQSNPPPSPNGK